MTTIAFALLSVVVVLILRLRSIRQQKKRDLERINEVLRVWADEDTFHWRY